MQARTYRRLVGVLTAVALVGLMWGVLYRVRRVLTPEPAAARPVVPRGEFLPLERQIIALFEQASPSVVHITTLERRVDRLRMNVLEIPKGTGTGFVWDRKGHVVTNYHVIADAERLRVMLADHSVYEATLVGVAKDKDLAVIRLVGVDPERLRPIPVGSSENLRVGQLVFAIGNPFGLDQTLTMGVISGLGREIVSVNGRPIQDVIQTDAAINPGNSGGPLLDSAGRLIGVNTQIVSPTRASAGIGFAVPVDTVNLIVPQLIRYGRVVRPGLGIEIASDAHARSWGVRGVLVLRVLPNSAAERAGMRGTRQDVFGRWVLGDVIVAIDGQPVRSSMDLFRILDRHSVGDEVTVTVVRNRSRVDLRVRLQALEGR